MRMPAEWGAAQLDAVVIDRVVYKFALPELHNADPAHFDAELRNMERPLSGMGSLGNP